MYIFEEISSSGSLCGRRSDVCAEAEGFLDVFELSLDGGWVGIESEVDLPLGHGSTYNL